MAQTHSPQEWEDIGCQAILDLLKDRFVVPWAEVEARISTHGWKDFERVQPVQLSGARNTLRRDELIIQETTHQRPPVTTIRLPFPKGRKRELERLGGSRRKMYRRYLSWAMNQNLCGKHAERVILDSAQAAASSAGLYIPRQAVGKVHHVQGFALQRGPLDVLAHILELPDIRTEIALVFEVKNIHVWIYPWARQLWELLVKAADVALKTPLMPVLACVRSAWQTGQMAKDIGFLICQFSDQLFSPEIDQTDFDEVVQEFDLAMVRHEGPIEPALTFLTRTLRRSPPPTPPFGENTPWYRRQSQRFAVTAPVILAHDALAGKLPEDARRRVFKSFKARVKAVCSWPMLEGW